MIAMGFPTALLIKCQDPARTLPCTPAGSPEGGHCLKYAQMYNIAAEVCECKVCKLLRQACKGGCQCMW